MINRNFTLLWAGKIVSQLGDKFYAIALAWWVLLETSSPSAMGFFLFVSVFPGVVLGLFAGALVDRWKRRNIVIVTDLIRGSLVLAVSCLAWRDALEVWHVFAVAFCLSLATAFFEPAIQSVLPEIVEQGKLPRANSLNQAAGGMCTVAGPLFGAMAVSVLGMATVFLANSISYYVSAILTCFIRTGKEVRVSGEGKESTPLWREILEGFRFLKNRETIGTVLKIIAAAHFFLGSLMVSLPFLAKGLRGDGVRNLGYLEMLLGAGMILGAIFMGARKNVSTEKELIAFLAIVAFAFGGVGFLSFCGIGTIYPYLAVMLLFGAGIALASVTWQSLLQFLTPSHMTGRVFGISSMTGNVSLPLAFGISGLLLNLADIWMVMVGSCLCLCGLCGFLLVREGRRVRMAEGEPSPQ